MTQKTNIKVLPPGSGATVDTSTFTFWASNSWSIKNKILFLAKEWQFSQILSILVISVWAQMKTFCTKRKKKKGYPIETNKRSHIPTRRTLLLVFGPAFPWVGRLSLLSWWRRSECSAATWTSRLPGVSGGLPRLGERFGGPARWTPRWRGARNFFHQRLVFAKWGHCARLDWQASCEGETKEKCGFQAVALRCKMLVRIWSAGSL